MARDADIHLRSRETVSEMRTFLEKNGEYGAASGCNDDRVITAAIASQMMTLLPRKYEAIRRGYKKQFKGFSNWDAKPGTKNETGYQEVYVN